MTDVLTEEQRRYNMSRIKGRDTKPELTLRRLLHKRNIRGYRLHYNLPGKPDIVFVGGRLAIFIDGCFWHKCPTHFVRPETRTEFWMNKIDGNVRRDDAVNTKMKEAGWRVMRFWEHEIRENPEKVVLAIVGCLNQEVDTSRC